MARQIPRTELDAILEIVGRFPNGAPFEDIAKQIATLPRRTLQRRLARLVEEKQLILEGRARGSLYRLAGIGEEPPLVSEDYIPISTESEAIKRSVREPVQKRNPVGYNRSFLDAYRPNKTFYLSGEIRNASMTKAAPAMANVRREPMRDRFFIVFLLTCHGTQVALRAIPIRCLRRNVCWSWARVPKEKMRGTRR